MGILFSAICLFVFVGFPMLVYLLVNLVVIVLIASSVEIYISNL